MGRGYKCAVLGALVYSFSAVNFDYCEELYLASHKNNVKTKNTTMETKLEIVRLMCQFKR
jgi:hypothetical protein